MFISPVTGWVLVQGPVSGFPLMPNQGKKKRKGGTEIVPELGVGGGRKSSIKPSLEPPHA